MRKRNGFTLIELLVVIAIIAILVALVVSTRRDHAAIGKPVADYIATHGEPTRIAAPAPDGTIVYVWEQTCRAKYTTYDCTRYVSSKNGIVTQIK